ncbi:MAG: hypothetical protein JRH08_18505 [Deltaproteobacteria bacterium]|nr:hypothetical protein [Deltaproteobacteria bacterium]MBW1929166.1 hypothetical protein [Deltaproteobacteria bacterium]MBW2127582.1 hypothetical protein [Deltaproteobacteria bacterium]
MGNTRTIITISEEDKRWLESYGKAHGISLAEAIRKGIRKLKENESSDTYRSIIDKTKGLWKMGDGLKYQRRLREEWDR